MKVVVGDRPGSRSTSSRASVVPMNPAPPVMKIRFPASIAEKPRCSAPTAPAGSRSPRRAANRRHDEQRGAHAEAARDHDPHARVAPEPVDGADGETAERAAERARGHHRGQHLRAQRDRRTRRDAAPSSARSPSPRTHRRRRLPHRRRARRSEPRSPRAAAWRARARRRRGAAAARGRAPSSRATEPMIAPTPKLVNSQPATCAFWP